MTEQIIEMEPGELWYGGVVDQGEQMPFTERSEYHYDLARNLSYNQCNPLLVSTHGRYLWGEDYFDLTVREGRLILRSEHGVFESERFPTLREAYLAAARRHFPFTGEIPAEIHFRRPQYCTWIAFMYEQNQRDITRYCEEIRAAGFPAGQLIIDNGWQLDYGEWQFHPLRFDDPDAMAARIRELGFAISLWVVPYVSADSRVCDELASRGLLVREPDGELFICHWWEGYSAVLDLTNPEAVRWFERQLQSLKERYGVLGFKMDAGDGRLYAERNVTSRPTTPNGHSELYGMLAENFELNEIRACCKCGGRRIVQRIADRRHLWTEEHGLRGLIPRAILQGIEGYPYLCPDMIGGGMFTDFLGDSELDVELIVRYCQVAALMPMMQFSYPVWNLEPRARAICRACCELHMAYADYIVELAKHAAATGEPILRAMSYQYPDFGPVDDQFLLGERVLVAPVLHKGRTSRVVRLPAGTWKYPPTGERFTAEVAREVIVAAPLEVLPYFEREEEA